MKTHLCIAAVLAATLSAATAAAAQTGGFDSIGMSPAIGSGPIGPSTAPPPEPPYHPTPGGGTSQIGPGYGMVGGFYRAASQAGPLTVPGSPDPAFPQIPPPRFPPVR